MAPCTGRLPRLPINEMRKRILQALLACLLAFALAPISVAQEPASPDSLDSALVPLEANGLITQALSQVGRWAGGLGDQFGQIKQAALELPDWFGTLFSSDEGRTLLMQALIGLAAVFIIGLVLEWWLRRVLSRPRRALIEHAEEAETNARKEQNRNGETQRQAFERKQDEERNATQLSEQRAFMETVTAGGTRPAEGSVALVQTHRNGIDRIEAVPVDPANAASGGPAAAQQAVASANEATGNDGIAAESARHDRNGAAPRPSENWSTLRHLPFAVGVLILDLLPLVLFFCASGLVMHWLEGGNERIHAVTSEFVNAYVITRVTMAVVRLLVSPASCGLSLLKVNHDLSMVLHVWIRRFVVLSTFGIALAGAVRALGASPAGSLAIIKIASLFVHIFLVILIFKLRHPVGEAIAAPAEAHGPLASMRNWLAQVWAFFAAVLVMGAWVVWALGVENGFPRLIHFISVSGVIIIAARVVAILALGALERLFPTAASAETQDNGTYESPETGIFGRLIERYHPLIRRLISLVITACTVVLLCQAWGLNAIGWFAPGTIGRSLVSAALTILVAVIVATVVWQTVNAAAERRLALWEKQGERMRVARLRTLLPMLRTCLLILIVLIVGLTALNELGINTTPLLAGASIIGVAIGFGSQKLVQDFITGIFLLMENAMQVGDWVTVAGISGVVEYLSIRTVRLRAGDGSLHIVPFSSVSTVNNTNRGIGNAEVSISVSYDTDIERAITELKDIGAGLRSDPAFKDLILNDLEVWGVNAVDGSMVTLVGRIQCVDKGRWGVQRETNRRILERFRKLGIEIADPRIRLLVPRDATGPDASSAQ